MINQQYTRMSYETCSKMFKMSDHHGKLRSLTKSIVFILPFIICETKTYFIAISAPFVPDFTVVLPIRGLVKG